jgi:hypothetical protein
VKWRARIGYRTLAPTCPHSPVQCRGGTVRASRYMHGRRRADTAATSVPKRSKGTLGALGTLGAGGGCEPMRHPVSGATRQLVSAVQGAQCVVGSGGGPRAPCRLQRRHGGAAAGVVQVPRAAAHTVRHCHCEVNSTSVSSLSFRTDLFLSVTLTVLMSQPCCA